MQHLTLRDVVTACRKALDDATLGALKHHSCEYDYGDGFHCAVGAALTNETLSLIRDRGLNKDPIQRLTACYGIIEIGPYDLEKISVLQDLHDSWADEDTPGNREGFEDQLACYENELAEQDEAGWPFHDLER